jgi:hypothetical protein
VNKYILFAFLAIINVSCVSVPSVNDFESMNHNLFNRTVAYYSNVRANNFTALWDMSSGYTKRYYNEPKKFRILMRSKYGGSTAISYELPRIIILSRHYGVTENRFKAYFDSPFVCERIVWIRKDNEWYYSDVRIGCARFPTREEFITYYQ